jgi:serine/threonine protein kinase
MPDNTRVKETVRIIATKVCPTCSQAFDADSDHTVCPEDETLLCPSIVDSEIGSSVGDYVLVSKIGEGSSGHVYLAEHKSTGKIAAAKLLRLNLLSDPAAVMRFRQEAQALRALVHPNITAIHDFGVSPDGRPFIVMDYVGSTTLSDLISAQGAIAPDQSCRIFLQIIDALKTAHNAGILHRDIKPSNIGVDENFNVKIIDFGIAKMSGIETTATLTRTGATVGTPAYMSPEQCGGGKLDRRSDIYSLGCLMFECLTGRKVFPTENAFLCMNQHSFEAAPQITKFAHGLPKFFSWAVMTCLNKSPDHRLQSMDELNAVLQAVSDKRLKTQLAASSIFYKQNLQNLFRSGTTFSGASQPSKGVSTLIKMAPFIAMIVIGSILYHFVRLPLDQPKTASNSTADSSVSKSFPEGLKDAYILDILKQQFRDIENEIARLRQEKQIAAAEKMSAELLNYRGMFDGATTSSHQPATTEVHAIAVHRGHGGIHGIQKSGLAGTVNLDVTYQDNPIILTLSAENPVKWKVSTAPGVRLKKIIITGPSPQTLEKPQPDTIVEFNTDKNKSSRLFWKRGNRYDGIDFQRVDEIAKKEANATLVSIQNFDTPRETIIVGSENSIWRAEHVLWRMREFHKKCMLHNEQLVEAQLKSLDFDGVWTEGEMVNPVKKLAHLTLSGPIKSTLKQPDMDFFSAIAVTRSEKNKLWYLLSDDRERQAASYLRDVKQNANTSLSETDGRSSDMVPWVAEYDPQKNSIKPLITPKTPGAPAWWECSSIAYDTTSDSLILLADEIDSQFIVYDIQKRKWSRIARTLPYVKRLLSACYCAEEDTIYALGTDVTEPPYKVLLYKMSKNGDVLSTVPLSAKIYEPESLSTIQLQSIGSNIIAIITNPNDYSPENWHVKKPNCAVIDRLTGKVIFSGPMAPSQKGK